MKLFCVVSLFYYFYWFLVMWFCTLMCQFEIHTYLSSFFSFLLKYNLHIVQCVHLMNSLKYFHKNVHLYYPYFYQDTKTVLLLQKVPLCLTQSATPIHQNHSFYSIIID